MGMVFNLVVFLDTFVHVDDKPAYVQRQYDLKRSMLPPQYWLWDHLMAILQLRESSLENFASWSPAHVEAMAAIMDELADKRDEAEFYMRYLGAVEKPYQPILSQISNVHLRADKRVDATVAALKERHHGQWHLDLCRGKAFGEAA